MNKKTTVGINGFGRIGRNVFRLLLNHPTIEVIAINDLADTKTLSHLLKYDSIHGVLKEDIEYTENEVSVAGKKVKFSSEKTPLSENETPETVAEKVHKLEYEHFPKVIEKLLIAEETD